jgi:hypothetical protein
MCYDTETDRRNSRVIIDACIPFRRKKTFPVIARSSKALEVGEGFAGGVLIRDDLWTISCRSSSAESLALPSDCRT